MAILPAAGIQSPDHAPTRSWQQIFGVWTAASHPARLPQHNLRYTQQGLWIPVATRILMASLRPHMRMKMAIFMAMTGWASRTLTAARITVDDEKALRFPVLTHPLNEVTQRIAWP